MGCDAGLEKIALGSLWRLIAVRIEARAGAIRDGIHFVWSGGCGSSSFLGMSRLGRIGQYSCSSWQQRIEC